LLPSVVLGPKFIDMIFVARLPQLGQVSGLVTVFGLHPSFGIVPPFAPNAVAQYSHMGVTGEILIKYAGNVFSLGND
jgi:hypothetical protein